MRTRTLCCLLLTLAPAAARAQAAPRPALVPVRIRILPPGTQVSIDGEQVAFQDGVLELPEGRHRLLAVAPVASGHDFLDLHFEARPGMAPIRRVVPRLAALRIRAPQGYTLRFDEQLLGPGQPVGGDQALVVRTSAGLHRVSAESERGRVQRRQTQLWPGLMAELRFHRPSIAPGLAIAAHGLATIAVGAVLVGLHDTCSSPGARFPSFAEPAYACESVYDFSFQPNSETLQPPAMGYVALGLGGAAVVAGTIWFAVNAADRPRERR